MVTVWRTTFLHYIRYSPWSTNFEDISLFLVMKQKAFHQSATEVDKKGQSIILDERPIPCLLLSLNYPAHIMYEIWVDLKELLPNSYIFPSSKFFFCPCLVIFRLLQGWFSYAITLLEREADSIFSLYDFAKKLQIL